MSRHSPLPPFSHFAAVTVKDRLTLVGIDATGRTWIRTASGADALTPRFSDWRMVDVETSAEWQDAERYRRIKAALAKKVGYRFSLGRYESVVELEVVIDENEARGVGMRGVAALAGRELDKMVDQFPVNP